MDGIFYDHKNTPHTQTGNIIITHSKDLWTMETQLNISGIDKRDFVSTYDITPFPPDESYTEWKSYSGGPEPIFGIFLVIKETILVNWHSLSGVFWGQEALVSLSPEIYTTRGYAFLQNKNISSFAAKLTRQSD
jgi:hypothetical protein